MNRNDGAASTISPNSQEASANAGRSPLERLSVELYVFFIMIARMVCLVLCNDIMGRDEMLNTNGTFREPTQIQIRNSLSLSFYFLLLMSSLPTIVTALYLGGFIDFYGRLLPCIIPGIGLLLELFSIHLIFTYDVYHEKWIFLSAAVASLFGGLPVVLASCYSFVTRVSPPMDRAYRLSILDLFLTSGAEVGLVAGIQLLKHVGFFWTEVLALCSVLVGIVWVAVTLRDGRSRLCCERLHVTFLGKSENVRSSIRVLCFPRPLDYRKDIRLLVLSCAVMCCLLIGTEHFSYIFIRDYHHWSLDDILILRSASTVLQAVCVCLVMPLLLKVQACDSTIALAGILFFSLYCATSSYAYRKWMLYFTLVLGTFKGLALPAMKAHIASIAEATDQGKIFTVVALAEVITVSAAAPGFSTVLYSRRENFHGIPYLVSWLFATVVIIINRWVKRRRRSSQEIFFGNSFSLT